MGLIRKKEGYVTKGNRKIAEGRTAEATQIVLDGLNDYQKRITASVSGYPAADTALVVTALRTLADALENGTPSCKPLIDWINTSVTFPALHSEEKVERTKKR